jgi:dihydroneopterin aldolase
MEFYGYHGVFEEENKLGQRFKVDLTAELDRKGLDQINGLAFNDAAADTVQFRIVNGIREVIRFSRAYIMDKVYVEGMEFYGYHGVFEEENKLGQRFKVVRHSCDLFDIVHPHNVAAFLDAKAYCRSRPLGTFFRGTKEAYIMDKVYVEGMEFYGYHGVFEEENKLGQLYNSA